MSLSLSTEDHAILPRSTLPLRACEREREIQDGIRTGFKEFPRGFTEAAGLGIKGKMIFPLLFMVLPLYVY